MSMKLGRPKDDERMITMDVDDLLLVNRTLGSVGALRAFVEAITGEDITWKAVDRYHSLIEVREEVSNTIEFALSYLRSIDKVLQAIPALEDDSLPLTAKIELPYSDLLNVKDVFDKFFWKPL